jgi:uncharacterized protein with HEPN domain
MQRDILLLIEMIDAAEQAQELTCGVSAGDLEADRQRRDALLWNFTVLGEAAGQLSAPPRCSASPSLWPGMRPARRRRRPPAPSSAR